MHLSPVGDTSRPPLHVRFPTRKWQDCRDSLGTVLSETVVTVSLSAPIVACSEQLTHCRTTRTILKPRAATSTCFQLTTLAKLTPTDIHQQHRHRCGMSKNTANDRVANSCHFISPCIIRFELWGIMELLLLSVLSKSSIQKRSVIESVIRSTAPSRHNNVYKMTVHPYVRLSTKTFFDFNEIRYVGRGWRLMYDSMQYDPIQGQGHKFLKVGNSATFIGYLLPHLWYWGWQMTTES